MANQDLLDILKQGVAEWNKWRKKHPDVRPDLSGVDLRGINLSGADLSYALLDDANLSRADLSRVSLEWSFLLETNLSRTNLTNANLFGATLLGADLKGAKLQEAQLYSVDFSDADLSKANLSDTEISRATFRETSLSGTSFIDAEMQWTTFGDVDLSQVKGLDTITHLAPSTIGIDTIYRSKGNIPEAFLRNAGVPDTFITYARSLVGQPFDFYSCFISYSSRDQAFARRLHADLQSNNVRCWFAPEDLKIGDHYHQRIDESIRLYDKLILILSEHAVQSAWVEREVVAACEKEDRKQQPVLFPIRLDDAVMDTTKAWAADVRRRWHIGDFTQWKHHDAYQTALERLLRDLKAEMRP